MADFKIAFAFDQESKSYLDLLESEHVKKWSETQDAARHNSITSFGGKTLFGDCPVLILTLENKDAVAETLAYFKRHTTEELASRFASGVFIRTQVQLNSTKSLRKYIEDELDGEVFSRNKSKRSELPEELLDKTNLSREVKDFLMDFAKGEPDHIIGIVRQVEKLNPKQQKALSLDAIVTRLPQDPQAAPPWDIEDPFWRGDTKATLEASRKICITDGGIVLLLWQLRKTARMTLDFAGMKGRAGRDQSELAKITDSLPNYGLVVAEKRAKKIGLSKSMQVAKIIAKYDRMIRGGSRIDNRILLESALIEATTILNRKA